MFVYTVRSSRRSVARPIAATIAPCKHRVTAITVDGRLPLWPTHLELTQVQSLAFLSKLLNAASKLSSAFAASIYTTRLIYKFAVIIIPRLHDTTGC